MERRRDDDEVDCLRYETLFSILHASNDED